LTVNFVQLVLNKNYFILTNSDKISDFYQRILIFKKTTKENFFFKKTTYVGYQSFINTSLYLARTFLFSMAISTASFDLLLLKNFNKIFFRVGDLKENLYFNSQLYWKHKSIVFTKGYPFYSLYYGIE